MTEKKLSWKEFKEKVEEQGITDKTELSYIDTDMYDPMVVTEDGKVWIE